MGSMVGTNLDSVDTTAREDMVSVMIYTRFHDTMATKLALFTEALSLMLSGIIFEVNDRII